MNDYTCPHCGAKNDIERGLFCRRCSERLLNSCTNETCDNYDPLSSDIKIDDVFCPICGSETLFKQEEYEFDDFSIDEPQ